MRIAIVSDIHANWQAWQAVRADMLRRDVEAVVCLGDIVGYGPNPAEVLADVRATCPNILLGNHDAAAAGLLDLDIFSDTARRSAEWTAHQLDDAARAHLATLPLTLGDDNLLYVHADPAAPAEWGYIENPETARAAFAAVPARIIFTGHTHFPELYTLAPDGSLTQTRPQNQTLAPDARHIINVGSVGDPRDETDRASYVTYDSETRRLEFHAIEFDVATFAAAIAAVPQLRTPWFLRRRAHENATGERERAVKIIRAASGTLGATNRPTIRLTTTQLRAHTTARLHADTQTTPTPKKDAPKKKKRTWPLITAALLLTAAACTAIYLANQPKSPTLPSEVSSQSRPAPPTSNPSPSPTRPGEVSSRSRITHHPSPILLMASAAHITGSLCLQTNNGITNLGCWTRSNFFPSWTLTLTTRTTFDLTLTYSTPNRSAHYIITAGTNIHRATAPATGSYHAYKTTAPARITLEPGTHTLTLKPENMKSPLMNIERITLTPTN